MKKKIAKVISKSVAKPRPKNKAKVMREVKSTGSQSAHPKKGLVKSFQSSPKWSLLVAELERGIRADHLANIFDGCRMPSRDGVERLVDTLLAVLFPGAFGHELVEEDELGAFLENSLQTIHSTLENYVEMALDFQTRLGNPQAPCGNNQKIALAAADAVLAALPKIREILGKDLQAAFEGDPAASSMVEVLLSYPCIMAIATHRMGHELYRREIPLLPRMMNEVAHSRTGIDIHPGAQIGPGFFIDHGTGVVIGETTTIGKGVKLYQGVTLGALSFPKDDQGNPLKGVKRHPDIEDGVTIYAGATVLGGQTRIGRNSVIGGNCWVIKSVPPDTVVMSEQLKQKQRE